MKNKGFTLVELLAVIVVLAIISIITIPMIGNVIDESKKKALEVSANGLVEAANYYTINHDGVTEFVFDENKKGETIKGEQLDYKGSIEGIGKLYIDQEGDISLCLVDDKYYVYKNYNSGIYVGEVKDNSCIIGYDVLTNKYVAMLDDGTGQISNVYSKDEVNNLIDNLQSQINDNSSNINSLQTFVNDIHSNLNMHYNNETDMVQIYYNGTWIDWKSAGLQNLYLYKNGLDSVGLQSYRNGSSATEQYCSFDNDSIMLYSDASLSTQLYSSIDITNYTKIKVKYKPISSNGGNITIGLRDTVGGSLSEGVLIKNTTNSFTLDNITEIECDISNYIGTKIVYIGVYLLKAEIFEIILE